MVEVRDLPFVGILASGLQSVFLNRGGSQEERDMAVEAIKDRADAIEVHNEIWQPFCIYPEGTTTDGYHLFPFRRGAFIPMRTIQPTYVKVSGGAVDIQYSMLDLPVVIIMLMSELCCRTARLHIMPIFTPTDFMLDQHADKGEEDWQIYSWCVRDAIAKAGDFKKVEFYNY